MGSDQSASYFIAAEVPGKGVQTLSAEVGSGRLSRESAHLVSE